MRRLDLDNINNPEPWQLALRSFVKAARRELGDIIIRIVLYGSRARGDYTEDSDIDVMVVIRGDDVWDISGRLADITSDILIEYEELINAYVIDENRYETRKGYSLYVNANREGVLL